LNITVWNYISVNVLIPLFPLWLIYRNNVSDTCPFNQSNRTGVYLYRNLT